MMLLTLVYAIISLSSLRNSSTFAFSANTLTANIDPLQSAKNKASLVIRSADELLPLASSDATILVAAVVININKYAVESMMVHPGLKARFLYIQFSKEESRKQEKMVCR